MIQQTKTMQQAVSSNDHALHERLQALEARVQELESRLPDDRVSIVVFSGELDRVLAAFVIATGAAALGQNVSMFFTFWGLNALRRTRKLSGKKFGEKLMALMAPDSSTHLPLSRMNFFGIGAKMMRAMMREKKVSSLEELMKLANDLGVRTIACEMSRDVMGISTEEIKEGVEVGGVATFLGEALRSRVTLFI
jgi:peroxiredoxin family protein